jgi:hypothetical protein
MSFQESTKTGVDAAAISEVKKMYGKNDRSVSGESEEISQVNRQTNTGDKNKKTPLNKILGLVWNAFRDAFVVLIAGPVCILANKLLYKLTKSSRQFLAASLTQTLRGSKVKL